MITKSNQLNTQVTHSEDALIDSGADTTCLGPAFHIISTTDCFVNMIGYDNDMVKNNLQIGDGITLATNDSGNKVLLWFNEGIIHPEGKSILSVNQMREHYVEVNDIAKRYGGQQNLKVIEGDTLPLKYKDSLLWLKIEYPQDDDFTKYPIIEMTTDVPWDPSASGTHALHSMIKMEDVDYEKLRKCLAWKPIEVIKKP